MRDTRTRNARGSGANLRTEIVAAAIALVDETNDAASLTLRAIARRAGISAPSIYAHFADLAELTDALLAESFDQLHEVVAAAMRDPTDPVSELAAAGQSYVRFGWEHSARYRLMFASSGYAPDSVSTFALVEDAIARCVADGTSTSADPHADAFLVWVAMHGMATLEKPGRADLLRLGPLDRPAILRSMVARLARLTG
jgi:AcrR family transcriptional regulator